MKVPRSLYLDLLSRPYAEGGASPPSGLCCSGAVLELLVRLGKTVPEGALPLGQEAVPAHLADVGAPVSPWARVGDEPTDAALHGDVVLQRRTDGTHAVWGYLGDGDFLTSAKGRGVFEAGARVLYRPESGTTLGVYRLKGGAR